MKIEELFKKAEKFFNMNKKKREKKQEKKEKLEFLFEKKITSIKNKIKETNNIEKKDKFKKKLEILKKLRYKIEST